MSSLRKYALSDAGLKKDEDVQRLERVEFDTGETLSPEEDRRIMRKLDLKYTPT